MAEEIYLEQLSNIPPIAFRDQQTKEFCFFKAGGPYLIKKKDALVILASLERFYNAISEAGIEKRNEEEYKAIYQEMEDTKGIRRTRSLSPIEGYIYFLSANKYIKIGRTKEHTLLNRIHHIETKLPCNTEVKHLFRVSDHVRAEKILHEYYRKERVKGEWFNLTKEEMSDVKKHKLPEDFLNLIIKIEEV